MNGDVMMKKLSAFFLSMFFAACAFAAEAPDLLVKRVTDEVLEIVAKDHAIRNGDTQKIIALVDAKVLPHFNFQRMTALALGREWRKADAGQKQRLVAEFRTLLVRTYANAFNSYSNQRVNFKPFRAAAADTDVLVRTEVLQPGSQPVQIDYSLELQDGAWKVYDVVVAGISLVTNYRNQFAQEIRDGGIEGLIANLAAKNKSLESAQARKVVSK